MTASIRSIAFASVFLFGLFASAFEFGSPQGDLQLIETPSKGHLEFIEGLNLSRKSVDMEMYHLTENHVADALISAAKRGVKVRLLLDGKSIHDARSKAFVDKLRESGVQVLGSSPAFSLTHSKSMIVDGKSAFITSINLTKIPRLVRDFGIITEDPAVISEMSLVFDTDWSNASTGKGDTPVLTNPHLLWSPINAKEKIIALIDSAEESLVAMVENITDMDIARAFARAENRGVRVRFLVPMCNMSENSLLNYPTLEKLAAMAPVEIHVMPAPARTESPYIHAKMIVADGKNLYIGSENFSYNSLTRSRELGIMFTQKQIGERLLQTFDADWAISVPRPSPLPAEDACEALSF